MSNEKNNKNANPPNVESPFFGFIDNKLKKTAEKLKIHPVVKNIFRGKLSAINWSYNSYKDIQKGESPIQAIVSSGIGAAVDFVNPAWALPAGDVANEFVDSFWTKKGPKGFVNKYKNIFEKEYKKSNKKFQNFTTQKQEEINKFKSFIEEAKKQQASKFSSLFDANKLKQKLKFKTRKTDITEALENSNLKGSNSDFVQQAMVKNNAVQVIEHRPVPVVNTGSAIPGWLSALSTFMGAVGGIATSVGGYKNVSAKIVNGSNYVNDPKTSPDILKDLNSKYPQKHTGGKVPGRGDVIALLQGGETVRTEAQENELQEQIIKKHLDAFAPLISGQGIENGSGNGGQQNKNSDGFEYHSEKKAKKPILYDRTRHDEEMIISIIADAWKSNRLGFRRVLQTK